MVEFEYVDFVDKRCGYWCVFLERLVVWWIDVCLCVDEEVDDCEWLYVCVWLGVVG